MIHLLIGQHMSVYENPLEHPLIARERPGVMWGSRAREIWVQKSRVRMKRGLKQTVGDQSKT
jgi:hypothetical protein